MRILIIITKGDSIGGAQIHVKDIASRLKQEGHNVIVILGKEGIFTELLKKENIEFITLENLRREINIFYDLKALFNIIKEIKKYKPDIVTTHSSKAGIIGRLAAKITKTPVIFTAHGWAFTDGISSKKKIVYKLIEKIWMNFSDKVITVSNFDKELALKNNIGNFDKLVSIQNGMKPLENNLFSSPSHNPPLIIMIARFQPQKDHISLIKALNKLKFLDWSLQLVGEDGGTRNEVENLVNELRLDKKIKFLGRRTDIEYLLSTAQIFVLTSNWEGFPLTILESMRAGLPVIASNVGGVSESVVDGETGYLANNFSDLVNNLKMLIESPDKRLHMGTNGKIRYEKYFTFDHMYEKTLQVYKDVIEK